MHLEVLLIAETKNSTLSQLRVDGQFFCFLLEDGYRAQKIKGETRIPAGTYVLEPRTEGGFFEKYNRSWKHTFVPYVTGVPGFDLILLHIGNTVIDTKGCGLVGETAQHNVKGNFSVLNSTNAYKRLYAILQPEFSEKRTVIITYKRDAGSVIPTVGAAAVTA